MLFKRAKANLCHLFISNSKFTSMSTTAKKSCNILAELLAEHNICDIVVSPGSRNAPLVIAVVRHEKLKPIVVVDERCAAFTALGMCGASFGENPIALICTSGSALLNYAPAIAEAYYRNLPLIIISADRPIEWIDQDDSQTIRQYEALSKYVKKSYDIPSTIESENMYWYTNRSINDAILTANEGKKGPVHINIQLDEPLNQLANVIPTKERLINLPTLKRSIDHSFFESHIKPSIANKKVLIIAGFQNCDSNNWVTNRASAERNHFDDFIANNKNIILLTETLSNITNSLAIGNIDRVISSMTNEIKEKLCPDIVITFGGALVSRFIKQYLRDIKPPEHWHIGITNTTIDCFKSLTMRIEMFPYEFFKQINELNINSIKNINYRSEWNIIAQNAEIKHNNFVEKCDWSDMKAFSIVLPQLKGNLHLSNGTPIRYQQLFNINKDIKSTHCNRGVSGIDGCTSSAIGHAMISSDTTTLITGDLSAQYDIGALSMKNIPPTFKMIVICNGGGGIFRFIKSTSNLPELDKYFAVNAQLPLKELASGYGFKFFHVSSENELHKILPHFINEKEMPCIMAIVTPEKESAEILKNYFK